jgi:hypothetical protein
MPRRPIASSLAGDLLRQRARVGPGRLGQHHRGIGREIAMRGIARRLDRHGLAVDDGRQIPRRNHRIQQRIHMGGESNVQCHSSNLHRHVHGGSNRIASFVMLNSVDYVALRVSIHHASWRRT